MEVDIVHDDTPVSALFNWLTSNCVECLKEDRKAAAATFAKEAGELETLLKRYYMYRKNPLSDKPRGSCGIPLLLSIR